MSTETAESFNSLGQCQRFRIAFRLLLLAFDYSRETGSKGKKRFSLLSLLFWSYVNTSNLEFFVQRTFVRVVSTDGDTIITCSASIISARICTQKEQNLFLYFIAYLKSMRIYSHTHHTAYLNTICETNMSTLYNQRNQYFTLNA